MAKEVLVVVHAKGAIGHVGLLNTTRPKEPDQPWKMAPTLGPLKTITKQNIRKTLYSYSRFAFLRENTIF